MGSEENLILCQSEMHDETNQECTVNIKMSDFHTLLMSHAVCSSPRCLAFLSSASVQCLRNDRSEHSSADEYKYDFLRLDLLINRFDSKKQHLGYTGAHKCRSATYFSSLNIFFPCHRLSLLSANGLQARANESNYKCARWTASSSCAINKAGIQATGDSAPRAPFGP